MLRRTVVAIFGCVCVLLAFTPAQARIVYTQTNQTFTGNVSWNIDVDNNGVADVMITQDLYSDGGCLGANAHVDNARGVGLLTNGQGWTSALDAGTSIGPNEIFDSSESLLGDTYHCIGNPFGHDDGFWINYGTLFLGLELTKAGKVHYGWAQFSVSIVNWYGGRHRMQSILTGYAYQTIAGKAILAGQT